MMNTFILTLLISISLAAEKECVKGHFTLRAGEIHVDARKCALVKCNENGEVEDIDLATGDRYTALGLCKEYHCVGNGRVRVPSCPLYKVDPGCQVVESDLSKPYPECCAHPKC